MERKSELTKALLGEKFKELVAKKGFEKLTIKMITDAAGVIRPTFYNYFQDKYEVMEWLLWEDVFKEVSELMEQEHVMESLQLLFQRFGEDKTYYEKVFEVTGQNSFEEMLYGQVFHMEEILVKHHPLKHLSNMPHVDEKVFLEFHAISLVNGLKYWLIWESKNNFWRESNGFYQYMMSPSTLDLLDLENTEKNKGFHYTEWNPFPIISLVLDISKNAPVV